MNKTKKLVLSSMFAVIIFVVTFLIKIPVPKGYINLGDSAILISGWMLPPLYSFMAAAVGSALSDMVLGYVVYAPATFLIKGLMALISHYVFKIVNNKFKTVFSSIISGIAAEIFMVIGYIIFEGFLYGFLPALINSPVNLIQGAFGLTVGVVFYVLISKRIIRTS